MDEFSSPLKNRQIWEIKRLRERRIGKRKATHDQLFTPTAQLARSPGHPFYRKLDEVLAEAGFDEFAEKLCAPFYKEGGRPSLPPGTYFRLLFIGYFEGIDSQRGIIWRVQDSLCLREFLGLALTEDAPDHSALTKIRQRLGAEVYEQVFQFVLGLLHRQKLLQGRTIAVDATTLEANAAMKTIVRKDTGQDWNEYLTALAKAEGLENPTPEQLRRLDRRRKGKKVGNLGKPRSLRAAVRTALFALPAFLQHLWNSLQTFLRQILFPEPARLPNAPDFIGA